MSSLPPTPSAAELEEEIDFTRVMIESLTEGSRGYEEERQRLEDLIDDLTFRLHMANGNTSWSSGASGDITPDSSAGNKRPASLSFDDHPQTKRQSPLPTIRDGRLTGSDHLERARRRQLAAEAALKRQRTDEALARSLQQQQDNYATAGPSTQRYQSTMTHNGALQRPVIKAEPQTQPLAHRSVTSANIVDLTGDNDESALQASTFSRPAYEHLPSFSDVYNQRMSQNPSPYSDIANGYPPIRPNPAVPGVHMQPPHSLASGNFASRMLSSSNNSGYAQPSVYHPSGQPYQAAPGAWPPTSHLASQPPNTGPHWSQLPNQALARAKNGLAIVGSNFGSGLDQLQDLVFGSRANPQELYDDDDDDDSDDELRYMGSTRRYNPYAGQMDLWRDRYAQLEHHNPEKTKEELEALLNHIRPDEDLPDNLLVQTPSAMCIKLHKYQELGLTWLQKCESGTNKGGILADDMGLGKTIQMLSLIVSNPSEDRRCKTTLIVAPVALLRQWDQEVRDKLKPRHRLSVHTHHGQGKLTNFRELQRFDVVLTTYGSLAAEVRRYASFELRKKNDPNARPNRNEQCTLLDPDCRWYRVILDEAQCIKNRSTQTAKGAQLLKATYRFCMTGTPMMNNVGELYSLIKFLRIKPYDSQEKFKLDIERPLKNSSPPAKEAAMDRLQALCKAVMLRRTKKSQYRGKPILQLPERSTEVDHALFDDDEHSFYQGLENKTQITFNKYLKAGAVGRSYSAILVLLLRLRQACCHPHLITDFSIAAAANMTDDALLDLAKKLDAGAVARIKETDGNFECPVCMDATLNAAIFVSCGHFTCRDCYVKLADPENAVQRGEEGARCPYCRVTIDPKQITDYISFKRVHWPEKLTEEEKLQFNIDQEEADDDTESLEDSDTESETDDADEDHTLNGFIVNDDAETESEADEAAADEELDDMAGPSTKKTKAAEKSRKKEKSKNKKKKKSKKAKGKEPKIGITLADLKKQANRNMKSRKRYIKRLREDYKDSAKIRKMMDILRDILDVPEEEVDEDDLNDVKPPQQPEKVLIFSQWTSLLDLCEIEIDARGWEYRRYDGSMNANMRADAVDDFKDAKKNVRIMLISLKAGNAGLNLNIANQVIILDPFWNPYIEEQAIDRAHRLGQTRPVKVHRILVENTVEDRIIALQENKRKVIDQALDEQKAMELGRLGVQQLAYLFGVTSNMNEQVNHSETRR